MFGMKSFSSLRLSFFAVILAVLWGACVVFQANALCPQIALGHGAIRMSSSPLLRCNPSLLHPNINLRLGMSDKNDEDSAPKREDVIIDVNSQSTLSDIDPEEISRLQKLRRRIFPPKPDDGLTFRQRLAKAGLSVVLSYGWVSNVSYCVTVSLAWYIFSKRSGLSPLAPGQWKSFLAVYAGFYVFNNIVRPVRFALSVSVSMYFDRAVQMIQDKFKLKRGVAIGITVFLANFVGTIALMCLGISIAATAAGVPVFAGRS